MRIFETIQRAEGGGSPLDNSNGIFSHGDGLIVLDRNEFLELLEDLRTSCSQHYEKLATITKILIDAQGYHRSDGAYVQTEDIATSGRGKVFP